MAIEPIVYTEPERTLIDAHIAASAGWDNPSLNPLRARIKQFYLVGQAYRCCYCRRENVVLHGRAWDIEHVISRSAHAAFTFEPENLAVACIDCNLAKLNADVLVRPCTEFPRTSAAYTIVHPHFDDWDEHFLFGAVVYAPITPKGAETLRICKLHRFYPLVGRDGLVAQDRRYMKLAEDVLFAKSADDAEVAVLSLRALIQNAKDEA